MIKNKDEIIGTILWILIIGALIDIIGIIPVSILILLFFVCFILFVI